MTIDRRRATVMAVLALAGLAACGDDGDGSAEAAPAAPTTTAPAAAADDPFCEPFLALDAAFRNVPEDPAELEAHVAEAITPNIAAVEAALPASIGDDVTTMIGTAQEVLATGDFDLFAGDEFTSAATVVYGALDDLCGVPVVEVDAVDFGYEGLPTTMDAGVTSFVLHNESESGELHQIEFIKVADGVDLSAAEILALPEDEHVGVLDTFGGGTAAGAGASSGTTVELTPGRWLYACMVPMGSVHGAEGAGAPHAVGGMFGEFTVT